MDIKEKIHSLSEDLLKNIERLVVINSQLGTPAEGMPFGPGPAKALDEALSIARELGFKTVNLDHYCGYAEMGEGDDIVGIAGHLDIVPAGGDWTYDPFALTRKGDYVYGRGTTDDKGPVLEALYAMKLLRDSGIRLNKRVRLIMGCNEETGSRCMQHYNKVAEELSCGFTPDANCTTVIPAEDGLKEKLEAAFSESGLIQYHLHESDGLIQIDAKGVSAHASMPALGVNAAGVTFACLAKAGFEDDFVRFYNSHIGTACDGSGLDLKFQDAYGDLTLCNGIVKTENGEISCTIDIRFPVTLSTEQICTMCQNRLEDSDGYIEIQNLTEPLFFPRESPLVEALYKAYTDVTGDTANEPLVIGGGTYAKSLKNIIAFGPEKPGMDYHIHGADEFLLVPEMEEAVLIYMEAIKNLLAI